MTVRASIAVWASAAFSRGNVCPMTGLIRPAVGFPQRSLDQSPSVLIVELGLLDTAHGNATVACLPGDVTHQPNHLPRPRRSLFRKGSSIGVVI